MRQCNRSMRGEQKTFAREGSNTEQTNKPMKTTLMEITPQIAASFLEKNTSNRPLNNRHVKRLAREMEMGRWKINGSTICLNGQMLIDGQHRLAAVVLSGCTIQSLVVEGLDSNVFSTIDAGKPRSAGDTLTLLGVTNANTVSGALRVVECIVTGNGDRIGHNQYTNSDVQELFHKYKGIEHSARIAKSHKGTVCPPSILAALHFLFSMRDREAADAFVHDVQFGANLGEGDGVYLLRERLMRNAYMKAKLAGGYIAALGVKAWNARRENRRIHVLKYAEQEQFPMIAD